MFKSFFPKPGPFFISAFIWALVAVVFWQAGGGAWVAPVSYTHLDVYKRQAVHRGGRRDEVSTRCGSNHRLLAKIGQG